MARLLYNKTSLPILASFLPNIPCLRGESMPLRYLTALPVYNEAPHVANVLAQVRQYSDRVLVVDDGSTDGTSEQLTALDNLCILRHRENRGYGAALQTAFDFALQHGYDCLVTIDCDGQHQPQLIPQFVEKLEAMDADIVSGSRYLRKFPGDSLPPEARRRINQRVSAELKHRLGLDLTDAFCGFKAYRVPALAKLELTEPGYAMPLELWVQAATAGMRIVEEAVPLVYLDETRSFGGALDDDATRMEYYHLVIDRAMAVEDGNHVWPSATPPARQPLLTRASLTCGDTVG